jgi:hypothetical protein
MNISLRRPLPAAVIYFGRRTACLVFTLLASALNIRTQAKIRTSFGVLCLFILINTLAFGQGANGNGSVTGRVTDPSGATVPDAKIDLIDKATNIPTSTQSDAAGLYIIQNVPPGSYDVVIGKSGFRKSVIASQQVVTGKQVTLNVTLEVGSTTETVEVTAVAGAELQTENATIGTTMGNEAVMNLPTLTHDVSELVFLQGTTSPNFHGAVNNIMSGSIAGAMADQNTFMLDGGNNTSDLDGDNATYVNPLNGGSGVMPTPIESVEEFRVNTNNMTADFSMSGGGQIMVTTKRGGNQFHGSAYDFNQNSYFAANDYYNNAYGVGKPKSNYNRFGGSIGGPISKLNVLGGGWYFFANYEGEKYPRSGPYVAVVPSNTLREGIITEPDASGNNIQYNLNTSTQCGTTGGSQCDPRGIGLNPIVNQIWSKYMPQCNTMAAGDHGLNTCGYSANLTYPLSNNFGVFRLDHDFGSKWRFFSSYRYFGQDSPSTSQVDIGGVIAGDKLGVPATASTNVYDPRYIVGGITGTLSPTLTNQFHFSYLANDWNWLRAGAAQEVSGIPAGVLVSGTTTLGSEYNLNPLNEDAQDARKRTWDGHDYDYRDDISKLHGTHLFTVGGEYFHQFWHFDRYDDVGLGITQPEELLGSGGVFFPTSNQPMPCTATLATNCLPSSELGTWESLYGSVLGLVSSDQVVATRTGSQLNLNPLGTPVRSYVKDQTYAIYFSDTWKIKPNLTLTYGLNYTVQMPPYDINGTQDTLVDAANQPVTEQAYMAAKLAAALQGQAYNPSIGFSPVGVAGSGSKYPYSPFYGGLQPRVAIAWSPESKGDGWLSKLLGDKATVIRAGYGRSYSRNLGINLVSTPVLGDSFLQPVSCTNPTQAGSCTTPNVQTPATNYRIGVDGTATPFPAIPQTLQTPVLPGVNSSYTGLMFGLGNNYKPAVTDSVDVSIQRQFKGGVLAEVSYVGTYAHNLFQGIDLNAVPWMMPQGGQTFAQAFQALYKANAAGTTPAPQAFFETALKGSAFCAGYANCTQAVATTQAGPISQDAVETLWSDLDTSWNFGPDLPSTTQCGICYLDTSTGYSNYNALVVSVQKRSSHGLTVNGNFTYGRALGTLAINQSYTEATVSDPWDLRYDYGPQYWDRKFTFNVLATYQLPFGHGQKFAPTNRVVDHIVSGWNISPVFSLGSGLPLQVYTGSFQETGSGSGDSSNECQAVPINSGMSYPNSPVLNITTSGAENVGINGNASNDGYGANLFGNNALNVYNNFRAFQIGQDTSCGGAGILRGQLRWNLDLGLTKDTKITERVGMQIYAQAFNVFNHMMYSDPFLDLQDPADFGALEGQFNALTLGGAGAAANYTRILQFGVRLYF